MRRRKVKGALEKLLSYENYVFLGEDFNIDIFDKLKRDKKEICIELGMGRGKFIIEHAIRNPENLYIGIEIKEEVLLRAAENTNMEKINNLVFILGNVDELKNYFDEKKIDHLYINFCDPWPKARWAKRRLTHKNYLETYRKILKNKGEIHFKTDSEDLFEFSLNEILNSEFQVKNVYFNLHKSNSEVITTEYEDKFRERNLKIFSLDGVKK